MKNANGRGASRGDILVVDDTHSNLQLLVSMLKEYGYKARPVSSGAAALKAAQSVAPDLILLDINMPHMDGYEVCRRLKAEEKLKSVPVIFISGLNEPLDKVRAFQVGGVDYITKPFEVEEVAARVETHLNLRRQQEALAQNVQRLRERERLRDALTQMIVHDMRSPLLALQLSLSVAAETARESAEPLKKVLHTAQQSTAFLVDMVAEILVVSQLEACALKITKAPEDLVKLAAQAIEQCRHLGSEKTVELHAPKTLIVPCDGRLVQRILVNLISNALKFTPADGHVEVSLRIGRSSARIIVRDTGPGISSENLGRIFEKFVQLESSPRQRGYGLGLAFVKLASEAHGGKLSVESEVGAGSTFTVELPLA